MDETLSATALLLVQAQLLSSEAAWQYEQAAQSHACRLLTYLATHAHICPIAIAHCLANHFGSTLIDLDTIDLSTLPSQFIIPTLLRQYHVIPITCQGNQLYIAVDDPSQQTAFNEIQFLTGYRTVPMVAQTLQLTRKIDELLREMEHQDLTHYLKTQTHPTLTSPYPLDDEAPIVAFVQRLFHQAIARGATDIHFELYANCYRIRYRKDGLLHELATPPQAVANRIAARLKIMADLDIAERRLPQDGRFSITYTANRSIDCRLSSCPTVYGEKIAIRILNGDAIPLDLPHLGLTSRDEQCLLQALQRPQGLILITGPTGSGKTVTLYAALNHLNTGNKNISSVEDPVEIKQIGINQVQINPTIGLDFATVLRALLRQDPDIIMIGEIRDQETADMAIKASQTGHLVLSTLHTNSSAETIIRLQQLGIPSFLIASSLTLIMAQRLIRQLCHFCKQPTPTHDRGYRAIGCHRCYQGYQGRIAIFETLAITMPLRTLMVTGNTSVAQLTRQAQQDGMLSLYQAGLIHVNNGNTSYEEIQSVR